MANEVTNSNEQNEGQTTSPMDSALGAFMSKSNIQRPGIRKTISFASLIPRIKESKVKVIYTGGLIGWIRNERNVLSMVPNSLVKMLRKYPSFHDEKYSVKRFRPGSPVLVLPFTSGVSTRAVYHIVEYNPLMISSNMSIVDWIRIANDIYESYEFFDAFVILHGTDTIAYTASALSFMLENLGKTVVLTGSQIPMFETRSDGKDNFVSALIIAANYNIPEVCILFGNKLMRGNRTVKISCENLDAFDSPNCPPLGRIGINCEIDYRIIYRSPTANRFEVYSNMDMNVGLLRIFPGIASSVFRAFLAPPMRGVVLQTFGSGNIPLNQQHILDEISAASKRGVIIVNCTQCSNGTVHGQYDTDNVLSTIGVIPGHDMTAEAAISKLSYVLGKSEWSLDFKKQKMQSNIRGELTPQYMSQESDLIEAIGRSMRITSPQELTKLGNTIYPAMLSSAVVLGDIKRIKDLKTHGADLSVVNDDNRSALHIACHQGNIDIIRILLENGASIHVRDRYDRTPLMEAISIDNHEIIKLLISCGAHLTASKHEIGEQLCLATARGSLLRLKSYELAGANLGLQDLSGRTALHVAAVHGHVHIVEYLISVLENINTKDMLGLTSLHYAKRVENADIIELLATRLN